MQEKNTFVTFLSNRIVWGFLAGFAIWLILALFLQMPLGYSPSISVIISMLTSHLFEPKRLAGLNAGIGVLAGMVFGVQFIFQEISFVDIGTIAKLYKQGVIF
jgi:hypothetical protein